VAALLGGAVLAGALVGALPVLPGLVAPMPTLTPTAPAVAAPGDHPTCTPTAEPVTGEAPERAFAPIVGTTTADLRAFALRFNEIRTLHCLAPIAAENFVWSECLEDRLLWIAGDPSTDPLSAWGHEGTRRSDGVPSAGCDGNLAGGADNTGATVAGKWWESLAHRASLYRPGDDPTGVCIAFAMTHGGLPDEAASFARAAARRTDC
jgi:hypothetical protein